MCAGPSTISDQGKDAHLIRAQRERAFPSSTEHAVKSTADAG
ncbi:hypothetical protein Terro_0207 [Terriglobus roseus DSM 18391]|uniref:Uncharacterized protein n=1 Tax=Terriglobus roseus (strain DSM 18391 / NRRL B-41598 / KBS 63) TaxID=926566 RepID=I3ZBD9_TERRK|nr:hypothetical protein Terro_0207 [Terriglobus roseus DSM 18391]